MKPESEDDYVDGIAPAAALLSLPCPVRLLIRRLAKANIRLVLIASVVTVCALSASQTFAQSVPFAVTRFGRVETKVNQDSTERSITVNGRVVQNGAAVSGDVVGMGAQYQFQFPDHDLIILEGVAGTGCPASVYALIVRANAARIAEPSFETCGGVYSVARNGDDLRITVNGFLGPASSAKEQEAAYKKKTTFLYTSVDGRMRRVSR